MGIISTTFDLVTETTADYLNGTAIRIEYNPDSDRWWVVDEGNDNKNVALDATRKFAEKALEDYLKAKNGEDDDSYQKYLLEAVTCLTKASERLKRLEIMNENSVQDLHLSATLATYSQTSQEIALSLAKYLEERKRPL